MTELKNHDLVVKGWKRGFLDPTIRRINVEIDKKKNNNNKIKKKEKKEYEPKTINNQVYKVSLIPPP